MQHQPVTIRPVNAQETPLLMDIGMSTGLFTPEEAQQLLGDTLDNLHAGRLPPLHQCHAAVLDGVAKGWVYFAPASEAAAAAAAAAEGSWDLWWIGVQAGEQGKGYGKQLLDHVERTARSQGAKQLVIETSAALDKTRRFYVAQGYHIRETVPGFYGEGEDKVVYLKQLK